MGTIVISLIVFATLIVIHEFGHFIVAKKTGVAVEEFSIGMGPLLLDKNYNNTQYSLRLLPIGGYCQMQGEDSEDNDEGSFMSKPPIIRFLIILAGPLMNLILAWIFFIIIGLSIGVPTTMINNVMNNYPAQRAGLKPGDEIISINNEKINDWNEMSQIISKADKKMDISVHRNGKLVQLTMKPRYDASTKRNIIGIEPVLSHDFFVSLKWGISQVYDVSKSILTALGMLLFKGFNLNGFVGPVGTINFIGKVAKTGLLNLMNLSAVISINLGVFNLIPIPALDGSKLLFILIEMIRGKPIAPEKENAVDFIGLIALLAFSALITYKDIINLSR